MSPSYAMNWLWAERRVLMRMQVSFLSNIPTSLSIVLFSIFCCPPSTPPPRHHTWSLWWSRHQRRRPSRHRSWFFVKLWKIQNLKSLNLNKSFARGLPLAAAIDGTSNVPPPSNTVRPGKNCNQVWHYALLEGGCEDYLQRRRIWSFLCLDEQITLWCLQRHLMCKQIWSF